MKTLDEVRDEAMTRAARVLNEHIDGAVAAEREACAKVAEGFMVLAPVFAEERASNGALRDLAEAIRARGGK